jgi:hypothetical protein
MGRLELLREVLELVFAAGYEHHIYGIRREKLG